MEVGFPGGGTLPPVASCGSNRKNYSLLMENLFCCELPTISLGLRLFLWG